jgi:molecular chaperone GrpE (heat shock protein)
MAVTDSLTLYNNACLKYSICPQNYQDYHGQKQRTDHTSADNQSVSLESYYVQIIAAMFHELMTRGSSSLLSKLCSINNIHFEAANFSIAYKRDGVSKTVWDIIPILDGINAVFTKNLDECNCIFSDHKDNVFQGKVFKEGFDYAAVISSKLKILDENIGRILSASTQSEADSKQNQNARTVKEEKPKTPDILLRIHDPKLTDKLNQLAENRRANDSDLSERIQQLQVSLQDELKQIMVIREGIDYNITQEAINQFVLLFFLVSETLQYHPNDENKDSYHNLVESCEDFLANIEQSLVMLGVTIINDINKQFDPEKHKAARDHQPTRGAMITKVVKIGFAYKDKVLEKAEVELA